MFTFWISPGDNACGVNYGGCGTLCLAIPGGRLCACADNQVLEKNNVTCAGRRAEGIWQQEALDPPIPAHDPAPLDFTYVTVNR